MKKILSAGWADDIYVATNNSVLRYNPVGEIVARYTPNDRTAEINDIVVDYNKNLYVSINKPSKIIKYDHDTNLIREIGNTRTRVGEFNDPRRMRIDKSENLIVLDKGNSRMCKIYNIV